MLDHRPTLDIDLGGLDPAAWRERLEALGAAHGFFRQLGARHAALFVEAGPRLVVTFEEAGQVRAAASGRPRGLDLVAREGWSLLAILADGPTWFRSDALTRFFDRQVDDGVFEAFERVLFTGTEMGAYGAAAYSVAAPGSHVLMLRPVATLDSAVAGWDRRDLRARRLDFTSRYGFGPDMVEAAARAWTIHDPLYPADAMQAALYHRAPVTRLHARHVGARLPQMLDQMQATQPLLQAAMAGTLDRLAWARLWRRRRRVSAYPRLLLHRAELDGRRDQILRLCRFGVRGRDSGLYVAKAEQYGLPISRLRG